MLLWLFTNNNFLTKDNLFKRGWRKGDNKCQFCDKEETIQHFFFACPTARLIWKIISCALNLKPVLNRQELFGFWIKNADKFTKNLIVVGIAAMIWSIWKYRNKACLEKKLQNDPTNLIHMACNWVDAW